MGIKYAVNEHYFEKWTPSMAYLLGYLYADGSLEDASYLRGKYLRVTSTDKELIDQTKALLESKHKVVLIPPRVQEHKMRYFLRIGSAKIYNDLSSLGLYPNKSLTMRYPNVPVKFSSHFIRGYFDGDGHVGIVMDKSVFKRLIIVFVSGSHQFLQTLASEISTYTGVKNNKVYKNTNASRLAYSTADSVKVFKYVYNKSGGIFLRRKFDVFKEFFNRYEKWTNSEIQAIIKICGRVVK